MSYENDPRAVLKALFDAGFIEATQRPKNHYRVLMKGHRVSLATATHPSTTRSLN
jgi:hypothetical protein